MENIKTFEDACTVIGVDSNKVLPEVSGYPENHQKALLATGKLFIINQALNRVDNDNKDWAPDWNDTDEYKYYPWFDLEKHKKNNPSGFRFDGCGFGYDYSDVGARLVYRTRKLAEYAGTQFEDLYRDLMVL
jgi:hypothetical protein